MHVIELCYVILKINGSSTLPSVFLASASRISQGKLLYSSETVAKPR